VNPIRHAGALFPAAAAAVAILGACNPPSTALLAGAVSQAAASGAPTPTPAATSFSTVTKTPTPAPAGTGDFELLAKGQEIFEKTAGGVGCASCHGIDGGGKTAPFIQGAAEGQIRAALAGGAPAMSFIKLSDEEILAVSAWVKALADPTSHAGHH
jgi:mono/diheme cytochrome c family protein